jgi:hypothetical protein
MLNLRFVDTTWKGVVWAPFLFYLAVRIFRLLLHIIYTVSVGCVKEGFLVGKETLYSLCIMLVVIDSDRLESRWQISCVAFSIAI